MILIFGDQTIKSKPEQPQFEEVEGFQDDLAPALPQTYEDVVNLVFTQNNIPVEYADYVEMCINWLSVAYDAQEALLDDAGRVLSEGVNYEPTFKKSDMLQILDTALKILDSVGR